MVVHERFGVQIPKSYPLEMAGPVMCSGVTLYEPLMKYAPQESGVKRIGIVGLGGLGVMGIKLAAAMGHSVTAISRNGAKRDLATRAGATSFLAMDNPADIERETANLDLVIDTLPVEHGIAVYLALLSGGGASRLILLGLTSTWMAAVFGPSGLMREDVKGSLIGSMKATQAVIDLCAEQRILPEIEVVPVTELNAVYTKLGQSNATGLRYVLDIENTLSEESYAATVEACQQQPAPDVGDPEHVPSTKDVFLQICKLLRCCFCCRF
jgi:D-arabinose 1-dehydrogenase-like Zn-dependent alcohol dehydrogenase